MLTQDQIDHYHEQGFLHVPQIFSSDEIAELSDEMNRLMEEWADRFKHWLKKLEP